MSKEEYEDVVNKAFFEAVKEIGVVRAKVLLGSAKYYRLINGESKLSAVEFLVL